MQDGFSLANSMMMYVVVYRNSSIKISSSNKYSHATLQISLIDMWTGSTSSGDQEAPVMVIIIAVVVGGLITSFCVGAIVWTICKGLKKKDKDGLIN